MNIDRIKGIKNVPLVSEPSIIENFRYQNLNTMAKGIKTGGRQKGSINKVTKDLRLLIKELLTKELENIDKQIDIVDPKVRLEFLIKLLPYALPRYEQVLSDEEKHPIAGMSLIQTFNEQIANKAKEKGFHLEGFVHQNR